MCWTVPLGARCWRAWWCSSPSVHLPHEDEDLFPPGVAELEGLDVVEAHGAVRRQAREVHLRVGQSGLPAPEVGGRPARGRRRSPSSSRPFGDRQPLSDLLADELLLHLVELSLDLRQRGDVACANAALPQGLALLAERLAALLLALLGHRERSSGPCAG